MIAELKFIATPEKGEVSAIFERPDNATHLLMLGHGASSNMRSPLLSNISAALSANGIAVFRYNFPYSENGRGRDGQAVCLETIRSAAKAAGEAAGDLPLFAGGHSFSGRMTSTAATATPIANVHGLIFFAFPLHPAGEPAIARAEHLKDVSVPMLFLSGERDALAEPELLTGVIKEFGDRATLHWVETADHSFKVLKRQRSSKEGVFEELGRTAAEWLRAFPY